MRVHHINNLNKVLQVIQEHGIKLVNISSDDIVSGNPKLTLGLIWLIALEFNGSNLVKCHCSSGIERSLLAWARQFTEPHGHSLNDFSTSWSDGKAFLMILNARLNKIDLQSALKQHPLQRLRTAFDLAYDHFNIVKLLDPEDVHTHKPDNKSIQMYVMYLYHAMEICNTLESDEENESKSKTESLKDDAPNVPVDITDLDEVPLESTEQSNKNTQNEEEMNETDSTIHKIDLNKFNNHIDKKSEGTENPMDVEVLEPSKTLFLRLSGEIKSRPQSTATNVSVEITTYQAALEAVLTLLLEDEQILSQDLTQPKDFQSAKNQFHENEQFMLKLTEHQQYVGEALEEGHNLINESHKANGGLSTEDQNEIRQQMVLLNERWETLRLKAMDVQAKILQKLADFQTIQIEKLRTFLTNVEDRISHMSAIGPTLAEVQNQLIEVRHLTKDLRDQQDLVDSLNNMVVIVNDDSGNFNDLEDKLSALGERWSHVVKWSNLRVEKLQQYKCISKWLDGREKDLKYMESKDVTDLGGITKRVNDLNYCNKDLLELERYLIDLRQMVAATLQEGDVKGEQVLVQLESFEDRLDALKQIVDVQTERIEQKGFKFGRERDSFDISRVLKPHGWTDFQTIIKFGDDDGGSSEETEAEEDFPCEDGSAEGKETSRNHSARKKRRLRNNEVFYQLKNKILESVHFIDEYENRLTAIQRQNLRYQSDNINQLEKDVRQFLNTLSALRDLYELCEREDVSRNLITEASQIKEIEERCKKLEESIENQQVQTNLSVKKEKFYNSLMAFKLVLADSRDWYKQNALRASKEELEKRLSDMESLSGEILLALETTTTLPEELVEWKQDFNIFHESWNDMKRAILTLIHERGGDSNDTGQDLQVIREYLLRFNETRVIVDSLEPMQQQLKILTALNEEFASLNKEYIHLLGGDSDVINTNELAEAWSKVSERLNERILKQSTAIENLNHFMAEYKAIMTILLKLENNLKDEESESEKKVESDVNLAGNKQDHGMELRKVEIDVISARNFSEIIIKDAEIGHKNHLVQQIKELNEFFQRVQSLHKAKVQKREQVQARTEELFKRLTEMEKWLDQLEINTPKTSLASIQNSNELFHVKCKFQALKETCEKESIIFRELNEMGGETLLQIDELKSNGDMEKFNQNYNNLAKKFTRLNARWTDVTSLVYKQTALLEHISNQLGEFKKVMVSESGYLDKLANKLGSAPENADAEEIIEELDVSVYKSLNLNFNYNLLLLLKDLENILRGHSDDWLEKIQDIGQELISNEFMKDSICQEIEAIMERWAVLRRRTNHRIEVLELEVSEAKQSEKCISQFETWLTRIDEVLTEHLENDVTIEDLPDDFQVL